MRKAKLKYKIQNRETGTVIEDNLTKNEALKMLNSYEEEDRHNGTYTPDFYEIVEEDE